MQPHLDQKKLSRDISNRKAESQSREQRKSTLHNQNLSPTNRLISPQLRLGQPPRQRPLPHHHLPQILPLLRYPTQIRNLTPPQTSHIPTAPRTQSPASSTNHTPRPMTIHAYALDLAQFLQSVRSDEEAENGAPAADAVEAEVGLFDEVLQVHAVEGGDEGAGCDGEGEDGEFEIEEHEGVAVCVEDGFYTLL